MRNTILILTLFAVGLMLSPDSVRANPEDPPLSGLTRFFQQFGDDLKKGARELGSDVDQLVTGSIDRLVLQYDSNTVVAADIIDFKTDRLDGSPNTLVTKKTQAMSA